MKKMLVLLLTVFLILTASSCAGKMRDVTAGAKVVTYDTIEDMEQKADLIVTGRKTEGDLNVQKTGAGQVYKAYSRFQIGTVLKDETGQIREGQEIMVLELDVPDKEEGVRYHVEDYTAMNQKDEYILSVFGLFICYMIRGSRTPAAGPA